MSTVVLACKSDPDVQLEVDAEYCNSLAEPYNVGLIEVTSMTASGKGKMRNGLRWLLFKLEQRQRKSNLLCSFSDLIRLGGDDRNPTSELDIPSTTSPKDPPRPLDIVTSPDSDVSSGGHGVMWSQNANRTSQSTESESRSSSSSLQWMMKGPIHSKERSTDPSTAVTTPEAMDKKEELAPADVVTTPEPVDKKDEPSPADVVEEKPVVPQPEPIVPQPIEPQPTVPQPIS